MKERERTRGKEKHLARRLVDNIINDYNIEMIDTTNNRKLVYFFALFFSPFFGRLFFLLPPHRLLSFLRRISFFFFPPPQEEKRKAEKRMKKNDSASHKLSLLHPHLLYMTPRGPRQNSPRCFVVF